MSSMGRILSSTPSSSVPSRVSWPVSSVAASPISGFPSSSNYYAPPPPTQDELLTEIEASFQRLLSSPYFREQHGDAHREAESLLKSIYKADFKKWKIGKSKGWKKKKSELNVLDIEDEQKQQQDALPVAEPKEENLLESLLLDDEVAAINTSIADGMLSTDERESIIAAAANGEQQHLPRLSKKSVDIQTSPTKPRHQEEKPEKHRSSSRHRSHRHGSKSRTVRLTDTQLREAAEAVLAKERARSASPTKRPSMIQQAPFGTYGEFKTPSSVFGYDYDPVNAHGPSKDMYMEKKHRGEIYTLSVLSSPLPPMTPVPRSPNQSFSPSAIRSSPSASSSPHSPLAALPQRATTSHSNYSSKRSSLSSSSSASSVLSVSGNRLFL